jgi:hypothetical protein
MSAANAPFEIIPSDDDKKEKKKDQYISFEVPIDPAQPEGLKANTKFELLNSCRVEDVLYFLSRFDDLVLGLTIAAGAPRFNLMPNLLGHDHRKSWSDIVDRIAPAVANHNQKNFERCIDAFLKVSMDEDISLDLKEFIRQATKPRNMSVQAFVERLRHLNNLIEYCPAPNPDQPDELTPKLTDPELTVILKNACPKSWAKKQTEANLKHMSLQQQTAYYTGLRKVEDNSNDKSNRNRNDRRRNNRNNNNNNRNNSKGGNNRNGNGSRDSNQSSGEKYCSVHGKCDHTTSECKVIKDQREQYNQRKQSRQNNNRNNSGGGNRPFT